MEKRRKNIFFGLFLISLLGGIVFFLYFKGGKSFLTEGEGETLLKPLEFKKSPFSGVPCENHQGRAIGVIFAQYPETMPLSGIGSADIVIEGPVASPGGITRLLAIYQCQVFGEVGSLRSVRPYMVDLAFGFDAILASWGGANAAIEKIKKLGVDWFDARVNPFGAFFRKKNIPAPHNGFATLEKLREAAKTSKMRKNNQFPGYQFFKEELVFGKEEKIIEIKYAYPVKYVFDPETGNYFRFFNQKPAIDRNTSEQVFVKNVILMETKIKTLSPGVVDVKVIGEGRAKIYLAGKEIEALWEKENSGGKLSFLEKNGKEIEFVPGPIWIEIVSKL